MGRLNRATEKKVFIALENSGFTIADFKVQFPDEGPYVTVRFVPAEQYSFGILVTSGNPAKHYTREAPGEHRTSEDYWVDSINEGIQRIKNWCANIQSDLRASSPIYDDLAQLRDTLNQAIDSHVKDNDSHFTREEASALKTQLDELVQKFEKLQEEKSITDKELLFIKEEVSKLKSNVDGFPKRAFFKTAGNKLLSLVSRAGRSDVAKEVMIAGAKQVLGLPQS